MYKVKTDWGIVVCDSFEQFFNLKCNLIILNKIRAGRNWNEN